MQYKFFDDVTFADIAYEATGKTIEEMFQAAGMALTATQVKNIDKVMPKKKRKFALKAKDSEQLLHAFLQELIFYKDADLLLLNKFDLKISKSKDGYSLSCTAHGEEINTKKHEMLVDVKAVSWHLFKIEHTAKQWKASVILDV